MKRRDLLAAGRALHYTRLDAPGNRGTLGAQLRADIQIGRAHV